VRAQPDALAVSSFVWPHALNTSAATLAARQRMEIPFESRNILAHAGDASLFRCF
jgi:hypothetical protein